MGYFGDLMRLLNPKNIMFWNNWSETRDKQTERAALVAPLSILFWEDE